MITIIFNTEFVSCAGDSCIHCKEHPCDSDSLLTKGVNPVVLSLDQVNLVNAAHDAKIEANNLTTELSATKDELVTLKTSDLNQNTETDAVREARFEELVNKKESLSKDIEVLRTREEQHVQAAMKTGLPRHFVASAGGVHRPENK